MDKEKDPAATEQVELTLNSLSVVVHDADANPDPDIEISEEV